MLGITNHEGNANQKHKEVSLQFTTNGCHQKGKETSAGKNLEGEEQLQPDARNITAHPLW